jgi:hypothetical protein
MTELLYSTGSVKNSIISSPAIRTIGELFKHIIPPFENG